MSAETRWPQWPDTIALDEQPSSYGHDPVAIEQSERQGWAPVMNVTGICVAWAINALTSRPALNAVCIVASVALGCAWWPLH
jgi:hypothetical protein